MVSHFNYLIKVVYTCDEALTFKHNQDIHRLFYLYPVTIVQRYNKTALGLASLSRAVRHPSKLYMTHEAGVSDVSLVGNLDIQGNFISKMFILSPSGGNMIQNCIGGPLLSRIFFLTLKTLFSVE